MVTFELLIQNQQELVYWYYPEGNKDKRHGVIKVDLIKESIDVLELAEGDYVRIIKPSEMNQLIDAINKFKQERGETDFSEYVTEPIHHILYADHAMSEIAKRIRQGEIPKKGMQVWY